MPHLIHVAALLYEILISEKPTVWNKCCDNRKLQCSYTFEMWWDFQLSNYYKFTTKSAAEIFL